MPTDGRFSLTSSPQALPGSCYLCGSAGRSVYVDVHTDIEFHGAVYICVDTCLDELAHMAGFIRPEEYEQLKKDKEKLETELYEVKREKGHWENAVREFTSIRESHGLGSDVSGPELSGLQDAAESLSESTPDGEGEAESDSSDDVKSDGDSSEQIEQQDVAGLRPGSGEPDEFEFSL